MANKAVGEWVSCPNEECDEKIVCKIVEWNCIQTFEMSYPECDSIIDPQDIIFKDCDCPIPLDWEPEQGGDLYEEWEEDGETYVVYHILLGLEPHYDTYQEFWNAFFDMCNVFSHYYPWNALSDALYHHDAFTIHQRDLWITEDNLRREDHFYYNGPVTNKARVRYEQTGTKEEVPTPACSQKFTLFLRDQEQGNRFVLEPQQEVGTDTRVE